MTFAALAGVAAALGIALALLGLAVHRLRLLARLPGLRRPRLPLEVVGRVALGQRQGMAAVRIGERVLLVSVGEGGVRTLGEVEATALESDATTRRGDDATITPPRGTGDILRQLGGLRRMAPLATLAVATTLATLAPTGADAQATPPASTTAAATPPATSAPAPTVAAPPPATNAPALQLSPAPTVAAPPPSPGAQVPPAAQASPGTQTPSPGTQSPPGTQRSPGTVGSPLVASSPRRVVASASSAQASVPAILQPGATSSPSTIDVHAGDLKLSGTVGMVLFIGLLTVLPALLLLMTSFTRILIVLHFLRQALGTQTTPPGQLLAGLALLLTGFVMAPTLNRVNQQALQPWMDGQMDQTTMMKTAVVPFREFMLRQTPEKDLVKFVELSGQSAASPQDVSLPVLMSAFATSELRAAFQMGFAIFLPFIVVDLVVSAVLTSMGMFMLPPTMIALPCKLLLFVLVDGWSLVVESLVRSFR